MNTPSPLPSESSSVPPPLPTAPPVPKPQRKSNITRIVSIALIAAIGIGLLAIMGLAASVPTERQMRDAVYGEIGPQYKRVLEAGGVLSKIFHGPHFVYHKHLVYATLDFDKGDGQEVHVASGKAGKIELTPQVQEAKDFILTLTGQKK